MKFPISYTYGTMLDTAQNPERTSTNTSSHMNDVPITSVLTLAWLDQSSSR